MDKDPPFEYPFGDFPLSYFQERFRLISGSEQDILGILGLEERVRDSVALGMAKDRCDLLILRILGVFQARDSMIFLRSRYAEAAGRGDTGSMENWRDLLRKAYHMQLLPALAMLTAPEPDGFLRTLFHPSLEEADRYVTKVRSEAREYLKDVELDL